MTMKETVIEIIVIAVGVLVALYLMNYMGYIQHNSGGIKNKNIKVQLGAITHGPENTPSVSIGYGYGST